MVQPRSSFPWENIIPEQSFIVRKWGRPECAKLRRNHRDIIGGPDWSADIIRALVSGGADLKTKNSFGDPLLFLVVEMDLVDAVRLLLELGVNVESRSSRGWTALMKAAKYGRVLSAKALIANGATYIIIAAERGHLPTVEVLLRHGANIQAGSKRGWTTFKVALQLDGHAVVRQLKLAGAKE